MLASSRESDKMLVLTLIINALWRSVVRTVRLVHPRLVTHLIIIVTPTLVSLVLAALLLPNQSHSSPENFTSRASSCRDIAGRLAAVLDQPRGAPLLLRRRHPPRRRRRRRHPQQDALDEEGL